MPRHTTKMREEARSLYLTGDAASVAEIARRLKVKPHTIGTWKKEEDWDGLRLKIDRQAAEKMVEKLATERVTLNTQHFKLWGVVVSQLFDALQKDGGLSSEDVRNLEKVAGILDRAQKGQRLARGLSLDGQTEEQIRAQAEADGRGLVDLFIDVVKEEIDDEDARDRIARALLEACPADLDADVETGRFRQDLLFRLNTASLHLPPLRRRPVDIPFLAQHFAEEFGAENARTITLSEDFIAALCEHDFPGNVRELRNAVERSIAMATPGEAISREHLPTALYARQFWQEAGTLKERVEQLEAHLLRESTNNSRETARGWRKPSD